ncbi:MAG: TonB-dependent receptor, partial [Nitrospinae bacterium]|nr:TonB-dependent receptor [Nitrospinota bacterium]
MDSETDYPSVFISNSEGNKAVQAGLIQKGTNFLTRWTRDYEDDSGFKLQLYYDRFTRDAQKIVQNTVQKFDLDFQHDLASVGKHEVSWGLNYQYALYNFDGNVLEIDTEDSHLFGFFVHDEISLVPEEWSLILGSKFEHNQFSGFEVQPNIRVLWTPSNKHSYWAAVSRAVRIPSPRSEDATVNIFSSGGSNPSTILREEDGSTDAENLLAYEIGYKFKKNSKLHFDIATFWFDYTDLVHATSSDGLITRNLNSFEGFIF